LACITGGVVPQMMYPAGQVRYRESLRMPRSSWKLLAFSVLITVFVIGWPYLFVLAALWGYQVARTNSLELIIDEQWVRLRKRRIPLKALDPETLGRASNPWPWRRWSSRWVQFDPIWTADSVGMRGSWNGKRVWLGVGTNQREAFVEALLAAVYEAKAGEGLPLRPPQRLAPPNGTTDRPVTAAETTTRQRLGNRNLQRDRHDSL
jgi:hypothetical protein